MQFPAEGREHDACGGGGFLVVGTVAHKKHLLRIGPPLFKDQPHTIGGGLGGCFRRRDYRIKIGGQRQKVQNPLHPFRSSVGMHGQTHAVTVRELKEFPVTGIDLQQGNDVARIDDLRPHHFIHALMHLGRHDVFQRLPSRGHERIGILLRGQGRQSQGRQHLVVKDGVGGAGIDHDPVTVEDDAGKAVREKFAHQSSPRSTTVRSSCQPGQQRGARGRPRMRHRGARACNRDTALLSASHRRRGLSSGRGRNSSSP